MNQFDKRHLANVRKYQRQIDKIYRDAAAQVAARYSGLPVPDDAIFSFDEFPAVKAQIDALIRQMAGDIELTVQDGVRTEWDLSNDKNDALVDSVFGENAVAARYKHRSVDALNSFMNRKTAGLNLSDRVWNYTNQFKGEIEMGLDCGIREGLDAASMARQLQQYLVHPDMLFRRVRDEHGILRLSQRAAQYHPGQGVYRSSYKNARRLAATETNIAYRTADHDRWQQFDFVVGIRIELSNNHTCLNAKGKPVPFFDICDELQGKYTKEFKFVGWHPHCRCIATAITKTEKEAEDDFRRALRGEEKSDPKDSENYVGEMPDNFKQWMEDNAERIAGHKTQPYFIRDNVALIDGNATPAKPLTPAEIRHMNRTPEREQELRDWWKAREDETRLMKLAANNMLKVAADYGEVDASKLAATLADVRDLNVLQRETKALAQQVLAMKKQEQALADLIPDVHTWHQQFTISELQAAHGAVTSKMSNISSLPLNAQKKALEKEIKYVADPTFLKPHTLHPTWKVAQDAYAKQLESVLYKIDVQKLEAELQPIETWLVSHPKAVKVANLLQEAKDAIAAGEDLQAINGKVILAKADYKKRIAAQAYRDRKKAQAAGGSDFGAECYTQERRDRAMWNLTASEADEAFHENAVEFWKVVTESEKEALWGYTAGSGYITRPLRAIAGYEYDYLPYQAKAERHIKAMTAALEKQTLKQDTWLKRDSDPWNINYIFKIDLDAYRSNPSALVGKTGLEDSFQSCGSCRETRFTATGPKEVIMNLYCPKGTKAVYAQPWSSCGTYGRNWDGVKRAYAGKYDENELILQRGARMRITKAEYTNGMWYIDVDVLGFDVREFDMAVNRHGFYCDFK